MAKSSFVPPKDADKLWTVYITEVVLIEFAQVTVVMWDDTTTHPMLHIYTLGGTVLKFQETDGLRFLDAYIRYHRHLLAQDNNEEPVN